MPHECVAELSDSRFLFGLSSSDRILLPWCEGVSDAFKEATSSSALAWRFPSSWRSAARPCSTESEQRAAGQGHGARVRPRPKAPSRPRAAGLGLA